MDDFLAGLEAQFGELVSRISRLEAVDDQPAKFAQLDRELVRHVGRIRAQYEARRRIETLQAEGAELDGAINAILIQLDECRKQLEQLPPSATAPAEDVRKVDAQELLDYATKITRFTRRMPGTVDPTVLPWPTEDWLRRGMLATLTVQQEQQQLVEQQQQQQQQQQKQQPDDQRQDGRPQGDQPTDDGQDDQPTDSATSPGAVAQAPPASAAGSAAPSGSGPRRKPQKISLDFDSDDSD